MKHEWNFHRKFVLNLVNHLGYNLDCRWENSLIRCSFWGDYKMCLSDQLRLFHCSYLWVYSRDQPFRFTQRFPRLLLLKLMRISSSFNLTFLFPPFLYIFALFRLVNPLRETNSLQDARRIYFMYKYSTFFKQLYRFSRWT